MVVRTGCSEHPVGICKRKPSQWGWSLPPELIETQTHTGSPVTQAPVTCLSVSFGLGVPAAMYLKGFCSQG